MHAKTHLFFLAAFAFLVILIHVPLLDLPYYWDEVGQFIPAALDIYSHAFWVPHSAMPNVHPPGVMAYLALVWHAFGYSIVATRLAMLAAAAVTLWLSFLLAIRLCRNVGGVPAFIVVLLLAASPLFYTQAMLAQLDMPAMLFTVLALLLFLDGRIRLCALACVALVLVKETGLIVPFVFFVWLIFERRFKAAAWFALPEIALALWLVVLYRATGHLFGSSEFTEYNLSYPMHPVRMMIAMSRRIFYLFFEDFHWLGWIAVLIAWRRAHRVYAGRAWRIALAVAVSQVLAVTVLGGAVLERYLLPVLPIMYTAFAAAWSAMPSRFTRIAQAATVIGMVACLIWSAPYPLPYENNLAMVDFVRLQEAAGKFIDRNYRGRTITTAWPLSIELRRPACGYVSVRHEVQEIPSFRPEDIRALNPASVDVLVLFSRDWEGALDLRRLPLFEPLMRRFYHYQPQMPPREVERRLGVRQMAHWSERGQWLAVYQPVTR